MPIIIPATGAEFSIQHSGPATNGSTPTWTFGVTGWDISNSMENFLGWLADDYTTLLHDLYTVTGVKIQDSTGSAVFPVNFPGTNTGGVQAPQVATLVKKKSAELGRQGRGRMYWPGMLEITQVNDDGEINSGTLANLQALADSMFAALIADVVLPVIFHNSSSDPTELTSLEVDALIATQRRRIRR